MTGEVAGVAKNTDGQATSTRIAATGGSGRRHPGAGGLRSGGLGGRGHLDPAPQPDQPDRPDAARGLPRLGAGPAAAGGAATRARTPAGRRRSSTCAASAPTAPPSPPSTTATPNRRCRPTTTSGPNPTTLPSVNGSDIQWRAVSVRGPHGLTTVAIDLSDVQHTVRSLVWLQFGIGVAVLVVVGIAGFAVVHRSLQPLAEVEQTAAAIAAGQLDRRVPERDPRTEVGRLSVGAQRHACPDSAGVGVLGVLGARRPAVPRTGCDGSSPTPATNCAPR